MTGTGTHLFSTGKKGLLTSHLVQIHSDRNRYIAVLPSRHLPTGNPVSGRYVEKIACTSSSTAVKVLIVDYFRWLLVLELAELQHSPVALLL
jgi:hypothetical protein